MHHDLQTQTINGTSRPYRLAVRTSPFHGLNRGSIPLRVTNRLSFSYFGEKSRSKSLLFLCLLYILQGILQGSRTGTVKKVFAHSFIFLLTVCRGIGTPNSCEMKSIKKMLSVHFYLRDAEVNNNPDRKLVIYLQLEIEGQTRDVPMSTKLKIPHRYWWSHPKNKLDAVPVNREGKFEWVQKPFEDAEIVNARLQEFKDTFREIFSSLQTLSDCPPSYNNVRKLLDPKTRKKVEAKPLPAFLKVLDETIADRVKTKKLKTSTQLTYRTRKQNIISFLKYSGNEKILINELKYRHMKELVVWMDAQTDAEGNSLYGIDHINKHATLIKQTLDFAVNEEYLSYNPIAKMNLTYSAPKPPKYLDTFWRNRVEICQAVSVQRVKDIAIFLMYTGFSYTDYLSLKSSHLIGACWKKERNKSGIYSLPPLLPQAQAIIEKYGSVEKMPRPDISDLNKELKHLGDYAKVNENTVGFKLSTSVFRETFGSMMENEFMLQRSMIKFMMGHTNEKQLGNYSSVGTGRILFELKKYGASIDNPALSDYSKFIENFKIAS